MRPVSATTYIDVPRSEVAAFVGDLANRASIYGKSVRDFRLEQLYSTGVGAGARFQSTKGGNWFGTEIEEIVGEGRLVETGRSGRLGKVPTATLWEFTEGVGGSPTKVTLTFLTDPQHPLHEIDPRVGRRWRKLVHTSLDRLREILEDGGHVTRVDVAGAERLPS